MSKKREFIGEVLEFDDPSLANELFGPQNANLDILSRVSGFRLTNRGSLVLFESDGNDSGLDILRNFFMQIYDLARHGIIIQQGDLARAYEILADDPSVKLSAIFKDSVFVQTMRKTVTARNLAQKKYLEALKTYELVFSTGPAGTGKTYLAVAMAISMFQQHKIKKIILTRPAVEAGEKLGFLPGDLTEKVNPYLRPLYDALYDMAPQSKIAAMLEIGHIEIAPLAFMRGRTLNDAFIILDEAQNTTREQMKMFLTRMGFGSRMVVTGDITQIDLPRLPDLGSERSGLVHALNLLKSVKGIAIHRFGKDDVVRHPLVGKIVSIYDKAENTQ